MQNVAKYAEATSAVVRLAERDGALMFEIVDDGRGFDPAYDRYGTRPAGDGGSPGRDRREFEVRSAPGEGTRVRGEVIVDRSAGDVEVTHSHQY